MVDPVREITGNGQRRIPVQIWDVPPILHTARILQRFEPEDIYQEVMEGYRRQK